MTHPIPEYLQPLPSPPVRGEGLGLIDPVAIISLAGGIGDKIHFIQYPKDRERKQAADALLTRAAGGDTIAEAQLRLLSGIGTTDDIATMRAAGMDPGCVDPKQCGWGTDWARKYGRTLLMELQARRAAGLVGARMIQQSTIPDMVTGTVQRALGNPLVWVAIGAGLYFMTRRRGRR